MSVNLKTFKTSPPSPFDELRTMRAVVDGVHPLDGWRRKKVSGIDLLCKGRTVVEMSFDYLPGHAAGTISVTTFWNVDPTEVLEAVLGRRGPFEFAEGWCWSGGPEYMGAPTAFRYLALGAPEDFQLK